MKILKSSGKYLERQGQRSLLLAILCIVAVSVLALVLAPNLPTSIDFGDYTALLALTMVLPIAGFWHYWRSYTSNKKGSEGEKMVTQFLQSKLSNDYYLIDDVVYLNKNGYKENIDHIVLGPHGIFALETKHWRGKVTYEGDYWRGPFRISHRPSSQVRVNASWVNEAIKAYGVFETLKVWVKPIVVFSDPNVKLETINPEIEVVTLDKLADSIISYDNGYNFTPEQLRLMGEGILKQASHSLKQSR